MRLGEMRRLEAIDTNAVDTGEKAPETGLLPGPAPQLPEQRAEIEPDEADLLLELAAERLLVGLSCLAAAAGRHPPVPLFVAVAEEQDAAPFVDDRGADRCTFR